MHIIFMNKTDRHFASCRQTG